VGETVQHQSSQGGLGSGGDLFGHTRWSLVAALRDPGVAGEAEPLAELVRGYWYPVYAFLRSSGLEPEPAELRCRQFFAGLTADIRASNPSAFGRFRVFLLDRLQAFLASPAANGPTAALPAPPQDLAHFESRLQSENGQQAAPANAFERSFAMQVLSRSRERLHAEAERANRLLMFQRLSVFLTSDPDPERLRALAAELGLGQLALQVAIKRLRQRFRELVESELAETVANSGDLEAERALLLRVLSQAR